MNQRKNIENTIRAIVKAYGVDGASPIVEHLANYVELIRDEGEKTVTYRFAEHLAGTKAGRKVLKELSFDEAEALGLDGTLRR